MNYDLNRYLEAQNQDYKIALEEIKNGRKYSHWIWYIFPQLIELGRSSIAKYYGISGISEATAYLNHSILRERLIEISTALLSLKTSDPTEILGQPDDMKVRSCMTLFSFIRPDITVFQAVIDKFYDGKLDRRTIDLLKSYEMQKD
ncbi:MAG: DUF1810 domain-containing protein [Eubacteriales bacterium]|nr:DUF1810 domain-containing protein [Eubacteriales bacterium]